MASEVIDFEKVEWVTLLRLIDQHMALIVPRGGQFLRSDADVDLYEEDGYLIGLANAFIDDGEASGKHIPLLSSIDERLGEYEPKTKKEAEVLNKFKSYRESMIKLAFALNSVSGIPIRRK